MTKEDLRAIFVEEAMEIIEKLDVDIINYEENPQNKELLNELFRGVHTLKGSANSSGFTRLGAFVHIFEDVLDHYRDSDIVVPAHTIDIFLNAVDIIKETMYLEVEGIESLPENYHSTLQSIKSLLEKRESTCETSDEEMADLAGEFGEADESTTEIAQEKEDKPQSEPAKEIVAEEGKKLYKINLTLDSDIYHRGYDHGRFFQLLSDKGQILASNWVIGEVPKIDDFDAETNYWKSVELYLQSDEEQDSIEEVFLFADDGEFTVELQQSKEKPAQPAMKQKSVIDESIKEPEQVKKTESEKIQSRPERDPLPHRDEKRSFVKIDTQKLDELFDSVGEMVITQNFVAENEDLQKLNSPTLRRTMDELTKITRSIQNGVMALRMVPVRDTFEKMKRVSRDASRKVGKEIEFIIDGEETEVDKTMVDSLSDPLIHIVRNAIDHGIEATAQERIAAGKNPKGRVKLRAYHKGGNIAIELRDDGRGINKDKVYAKALEQGLVSPGDELSDQQIYGLIMQAGFSTADQISDISGRGVGLDVVRSSIEKLQGKIEIDSKMGEGSVFTILLPLTLAIIDGMLIKSAGDTFIIPTLSVLESFMPTKDIVHTARGKGEYVDLRGEMIPVVRLNQVLGISRDNPNIWESTLVCVENEEGKYAILIDDLVGRQQVVIKSLGKALAKLEGISGGAVMGNGDIALILNIEDLFIKRTV